MVKNDDSSSSDDEISAAALREACDDNFLPQSLFSTNNSSTRSDENEREIKEETKPSLRITERTDNFKSFGVSQNFKDFVAKKLNDMLDRHIEVDVDNCEDQVPKKRKRKKRVKSEAGIKLLSSSDTSLITVEEPEVVEKRVKPCKFSEESETNNIVKCQEVAVDPEWILSKIETNAWKERKKGDVFKYKKDSNGVLVEDK